MLRLSTGLLTLVMLILCPGICLAHFIWLAVADETINVYFGELPEADDPEFLKGIATAKVWSRAADGKLQAVVVKLGEESLVAPVPAGADLVCLAHNYGVIARGGSEFSLRYYAKTFPTSPEKAWPRVNDQEKLPLEVSPAWQDGKLTLTVTWQGKPAADVEVTLDGPGLADVVQQTDKNGQTIVELKEGGQLAARAKLVEETAGKQDGKSYKSIRHYSTLTLPVKLPTTK